MQKRLQTSVPLRNTKPTWVYADLKGHAIYLNPTVVTGKVLKITLSGVNEVNACSDIQCTPQAYATISPITFVPMTNLAEGLGYVHEFVMPQLPLAPSDRLFATAWALSLPLVEWMDDFVHISLVSKSPKPAQRVQHKLGVLLLGASINTTKLPLTNDVNNTSLPIFLNASFDSEYDLQLPRPTMAIDTGKTKFIQSTSHLDIVRLHADDTLSDPRRYSITDDSIHMARSHILSAHAYLISRVLRLLEKDLTDTGKQSSHEPVILTTGKRTIAHTKLIQWISDEIKAAEPLYMN